MRKTWLAAALAAATLLIAPTLSAWGPDGHKVVAKLAEAHLSPAAKAHVIALLNGDDLASVATWADDIRNQRDETYNWHFVDIPRNAAAFDEGRDCFLPSSTHEGAATDHHNCVVDRIELFESILKDSSASATDRAEALRFIVHFVGDIHQPFHAIGDFAGANGIKITEFGTTNCGRPCNLHQAWDSGLINHTGMDVTAYVSHLEQLIQSGNLHSQGAPADWANESHVAAQAAWVPNNGVVDDDYYQQQIAVVDSRLALAGLRLAALLNAALGQGPNVVGPSTPSSSSALTGTTIKNVYLREEASKSSGRIKLLKKGTEVEVLSAQPQNGFYHVQTEEGEEGWVATDYLEVNPLTSGALNLPNAPWHPAQEISASWDKPDPNKVTFKGDEGNCPWNGNKDDPDTFWRKNRTDIPAEYNEVEFAALHDLPFPHDSPKRVDWEESNLAKLAKYEGSAVSTVGYIVAIKPQNGGNGEGTNCHFTKAADTDIHIAIVGEFGDGEADSVVIEVTPRFKKDHPNWSKAFLTRYLDKETPVRISGWLMFDPDHRNHLNKYRYTLWEIHPITKIEALINGAWKDVDGLQ